MLKAGEVLQANRLQRIAKVVLELDFDLHIDRAPAGLLAFKVALRVSAEDGVVCHNFAIPVCVAVWQSELNSFEETLGLYAGSCLQLDEAGPLVVPASAVLQDWSILNQPVLVPVLDF